MRQSAVKRHRESFLFLPTFILYMSMLYEFILDRHLQLFLDAIISSFLKDFILKNKEISDEFDSACPISNLAILILYYFLSLANLN